MTKIFAASAYVAVMSLAIVGESPRAAQRTTGALAKSDCGEGACARSARRSDGTRIASLARTGVAETTVTRSAR